MGGARRRGRFRLRYCAPSTSLRSPARGWKPRLRCRPPPSAFSLPRATAPPRQRRPHLRGVRAFDGLENRQRRRRPGDGLGAIPQRVEHAGGVEKRVAFSAPVADLAVDHQRLLVILDGLAQVAQGGVDDAEVAQRVAFPLSFPSSSLGTPLSAKLCFVGGEDRTCAFLMPAWGSGASKTSA